MFQTGCYRNVVLVAAESALAGVNYAEPQSACLMGDGAAALVLSQSDCNAVLGFSHCTFAEHIELCRVEGGGHKRPVFDYDATCERDYRFTMDGPAVFRVALQHLKPMVIDLLEAWQSKTMTESSLIHWVPHQASPRALLAVKRLFQVSDRCFHIAVGEVGNMVAASLPFMIDRVRRNQLVAAGETIIAMGTSAGYSQAAIVFQL
jgi:3-oxoacyl-[acyl-carrier-protein] synthase-3